MKYAAAGISAVVAALSGAFIYYCEALQLLPLTQIGLISRLVITGSGIGALFFLLYLLFRNTFKSVKRQEWILLTIISLIISVCIMVWVPFPQTGLFREHTLTIRAIPDENNEIRPVTLSWFHLPNRDVTLNSIPCSNKCEFTEYGPTLSDPEAEINWKGITGSLVTLEFVSGDLQGIAEITWDGVPVIAALNNPDMPRLSFDFSFPVSNGLSEFTAVFLICYILSLYGTLSALKLLPSWGVKSFGIGAFICFSAFRIIQFLTVSQPLTFIDSESYLGMSKMSVIDILRGKQYCHEQFWYCISRPALIPLIYKLCAQNLKTITIVQLVISILCWTFFTSQAIGLYRSDRCKKALIILLFGLGCIPNVTRWDHMIMSESLSISAALLLMGSCFLLIRPNKEKQWKWLPALYTAVSALFYAQTRDSGVWSIISLIPVLLCLTHLRDKRRIIILLCAALAVICGIQMSSTGGRWQYPFENVLFNRIVRTEGGEEFFISEGMPTPPRIEELYGSEHMMGSALFNSDEMAPLRKWIQKDGLKTYLRFLLHTPSETLKMAWNAGFEQEAFEKISYTFTPFGFRQLLPDPIVKFFSCNLPAVLFLLICIAGIIKAFKTPDGERFAFPLLFLMSAYILCTGVILADEYEFSRHSIVIIIMMKAAAWPLIVLLSEK